MVRDVRVQRPEHPSGPCQTFYRHGGDPSSNRDSQSRGAEILRSRSRSCVLRFNFGEAINSFRHAAELDPNSAMPYWGIALANGPNYNAWIVSRDRERAGFDAIQTAVGLEPNAPEPERSYIDALARCFTDDPAPNQSKLARDYSDAMREVYRRHPDDPDAAALFAASLMNLNPWRLWSIDGKPGPDTLEIVAVLEQALRRWPEHTGVNHFYIHTMEGSSEPERALPSAHRMETLAPAAGHLVQYAVAHLYANRRLRGSGQRAMRGLSPKRIVNISVSSPSRAGSGFMGYSSHNQHFLAVAASMDGEFEKAANAAKEIQSHSHSEAMAAMSTLVLLRFARWDQILASQEPDPNQTAVTFLWHYARASAYAAKSRLKEAVDEQRMMEEAFSRLPQGRAFGTFFNDWSIA